MAANNTAKVMSGARAVLQVYDPTTKVATSLGIFSNVSYGVTYDTQPAYTLGNYAPVEIDYTAQDVVSVTASGWRVVDAGPHAGAKMPHLSELMSHEYMELQIFDRQTNKMIAKIANVRPVSFSTSNVARSLSEVTINFVGRLFYDESDPDGAKATEAPGDVAAPTLP